MKIHMRAGERRSIARYRSHFSGTLCLTALTYRFASLVMPILAIAFFGFVAFEQSHQGHHGFAMAAAAPLALEGKLTGIETELKKFIEKHAEEVKTQGAASTETKTTLEHLGTQHKETSARLLAIEQKLTASLNGGEQGEQKSVGQMVVESDGFKSMKAGGNSTGKIQVGSMFKTNLVNATGQNQPLVAPYIRPGIVSPGLRRLTIRDLMPNIPVASNLVEFAREVSFTSAAAMQTAEGAAKAESALSFELKYAPVQTLAHWIPVSRQLLDDAPAIQGYVNSRLSYGLKLKEEDELLNGAGVGTDISGLIANSTTYDTTLTNVATDTLIDVISHAITQASLSYFDATAIILHPKDWEAIKLIKTTGSASSGQYIFSDPHSADNPSLWGLPVVPTQSMAQSQFLVGAFDMAAAVWDRNQATIEISREHSDFFTRNLAAILCEERLALTVFRPLALVYGGFPYGS